jgi:hypothetical protein
MRSTVNIFTSSAFRFDGNSALHTAALFGNEQYVARLLCRGADANIRNDCANTPLHCAVCGDTPRRESIVRLLMTYGADAFISNGACTPIEMLVARGTAGAELSSWMAAQPPPAERPRPLMRRDAAPAGSSKATDSDFTESEDEGHQG